MKNRIMKLIAFAAVVAVMLAGMTACEEEEDSSVTEVISQMSDTSVRQGRRLSKSFSFLDTSSVLMMKRNRKEYDAYRTVKVANEDFTILQEWFLDYVHTNCGQWYSTLPGDEAGVKYGYFYEWERNFGTGSRMRSFDNVIFNRKTLARENGFHIPTEDDIRNIGLIYSDKSLIPNDLELYIEGEEELIDRDLRNYIDFVTSMWINSNSANKKKGCGVVVWWPTSQNGKVTYGYTNNPTQKARIRLVRTITPEQW